MLALLVLLVLQQLLAACQCSQLPPPSQPRNILVTVVGVSGSQNLVMCRFAEYLADRGHNVLVLHGKYIHKAQMPKARKFSIAKYLQYVGMERELGDQFMADMWDVPWKNDTHGRLPPLSLFSRLYNGLLDGCEAIAAPGSPVIEELKKTKWDAAVIHFVDMCAYGMTEVLGIKSTVWMSTFFMLEIQSIASGAPLPVSSVPASFANWGDDMSLAERAMNLVGSSAAYGMFHLGMLPGYTQLFRKLYGPQFPELGDILRRTQLYYINADPFFEFPRPIQHNIIYVGGLTMEQPEALDDYWTQIVDQAPKGLVIFSLGTVANTSAMPLSYKQVFADAFAAYPDLTFIYRVEGDMPAKLPANVIHVNWLPQKDLLAHPKVRAFITHGGYNSLTEATYLGVPLVVMPLFCLLGDQHANVARVKRAGVGTYLDKDSLSVDSVKQAIADVVKRAGVGTYLDKDSLSVDSVKQAIADVVYDDEMQARADRLSLMMRRRPQQPLSTAIEWVEFLAEFGDLSALQPRAAHMPLYKYFNADLYALVFLTVAVGLYIGCALCKTACRCCCRRNTTVKQKRA